MKTTAFPYYTPPFAEYNVAQQAVVPFLAEDLNLVVSFATAAGKTVLAECCFGFHLQSETECRVAYVCPFKSLASEKFQDWKDNSQFNEHGIVLSSTDSSAGIEDHEAARIAVITCESFDAKTRSRAYRDWLKSLSCVVYDECFTGTSTVVTEKGIMTMDEVVKYNLPLRALSYCHKTNKAEFKKIVAKRKKMLHRLWYSIEYHTGHIEVTHGQPVWVEGLGYIRAETVREGDIIYVNKELYFNDENGRERDSRHPVGRWKSVRYRNGEKCKAESSAVNFAEATCRMEVQKVEKIGFNPAERCTKRRIWKRALSIFNPFISRIVGFKRVDLSFGEKGRNGRMAVSNNPSDSTGSLVYGRRESRKEFDENTHGRIFKDGKRTAFFLACGKMGSFLSSISGWKILVTHVRREGKGYIPRHSKELLDSGHGVQSDAEDGRRVLFNVREGVSSRQKADICKQKNHSVWSKRLFGKVEKDLRKNSTVLSACYDVEVEDNSNLFVDGVLCHNCHLMNDKSRGGAVEVSMMRLTALNPSARLVLLSATMGNAMELARWVKTLNGKQTKCFVSTWRPSRIDTDYLPVQDNTEKVNEAVRLAVESRGKTIVFVHSKLTGSEIVKKLRRLGVRAVFHNASVRSGIRAKMEAAFNDKMSGLNVLVSTSTLGAGVNIGN